VGVGQRGVVTSTSLPHPTRPGGSGADRDARVDRDDGIAGPARRGWGPRPSPAATGYGFLAISAAIILALAPEPAPADQPSVTAQPTGQANYPIQRRVRYSFTLQNQGATPLEQGSLAVYAPVRLTSTQRLEGLTASVPAQVETDPWGNQILHVEVGLLPPYASRVVTIDAQLALADVAQPLSATAPELRIFTQPERFIESDDPRIKTVAKMLRTGSTLETAQQSYAWVRQSLGRSEFTPEDRGALRAMQDKAGDCTEHAYLFAALLRANGVPARVMGGYLMAESGLLRPHDYHNWAEFYYDGAWRIADPHQGNFMRNASRYVATHVMSGSGASLLGMRHRYAVTGGGLRVTMN
jgi:Transglutaminase-like superfamily